VLQGRVLVVGCGDSVYGLAIRDGHELWHVTRGGLSATGLTLAADDVYVSWSNAGGGAGLVSALDATGGAPAWEQPTSAGDPTAVAVARRLALYTDGPMLVARDATTGVQHFTQPFASSRVSVGGGVAYDAHGDRVDLRSGQLLAPLTLLSHGGDSPPAIDGGTLFYAITSLEHVVQSLDPASGAEHWQASYVSSEELPTGPSVAGGVIWLVGTTGVLQGFDEATGASEQSLATKPPFEGFADSQPPIVSHGFLVLTAYGLQAFSVPRA
jgi:outer membrane protein assembly factor BamB